MIHERDDSGSLRAVYNVREADDHKIPREVVVSTSNCVYLQRELTLVNRVYDPSEAEAP